MTVLLGVVGYALVGVRVVLVVVQLVDGTTCAGSLLMAM